jgi:trimeric autotransporter adhesin
MAAFSLSNDCRSAKGASALSNVAATAPASRWASVSTPLTFTLGGAAGSQTLYIAVQSNIAPQIEVQSLTLSASQTAGGGSVQGTVTLTGAAPAGGAIVALSSSSASATVPATVTVPADSTSATFTISTTAVASNQSVTITAAYGGNSAQAVMSLTPPAAPLFSSLIAVITFAPVGSSSSQFPLTITPDAGNVTYSATEASGMTFTGGTVSNQGQTFTFNNFRAGVDNIAQFIYGANDIQASSVSMVVTLQPTPNTEGALGTITGTLTVTGTPFPAGGASMTLSGTLSGSYEEVP